MKGNNTVIMKGNNTVIMKGNCCNMSTKTGLASGPCGALSDIATNAVIQVLVFYEYRRFKERLKIVLKQS